MPTQKINALLVKLTLREFSNNRQDVETTTEILQRKQMLQGAGKWIKYLFPEEAFKPVRKEARKIRVAHYDMTVPWEAGYRLCPAKAQPKYVAEFEKLKATAHKQIEAFLKNYKHWIAEAKKMHGKQFDETLYPSDVNMRSHYEIAYSFHPVPLASHFMTEGLASAAVEEMRTKLQNENEQRIQEATKDTWNRLLLPIKMLADKFSEKKPIVHDSIIGNIKEILALIPELNLTDDASMKATAKEIQEKFATLSVDDLRQNVEIRKAAAKEAAALVARFGQIGKRRFA